MPILTRARVSFQAFLLLLACVFVPLRPPHVCRWLLGTFADAVIYVEGHWPIHAHQLTSRLA